MQVAQPGKLLRICSNIWMNVLHFLMIIYFTKAKALCNSIFSESGLRDCLDDNSTSQKSCWSVKHHQVPQ